jgi:DNA repair exonuclease SbcCD nuclease subunit
MFEGFEPFREAGIPVHFAVGNHDNRNNLTTVLPVTCTFNLHSKVQKEVSSYGDKSGISKKMREQLFFSQVYTTFAAIFVQVF